LLPTTHAVLFYYLLWHTLYTLSANPNKTNKRACVSKTFSDFNTKKFYRFIFFLYFAKETGLIINYINPKNENKGILISIDDSIINTFL